MRICPLPQFFYARFSQLSLSIWWLSFPPRSSRSLHNIFRVFFLRSAPFPQVSVSKQNNPSFSFSLSPHFVKRMCGTFSLNPLFDPPSARYGYFFLSSPPLDAPPQTEFLRLVHTARGSFHTPAKLGKLIPIKGFRLFPIIFLDDLPAFFSNIDVPSNSFFS